MAFDSLLARVTDGAPVATLLLAAIVAISAIGLFWKPALIERFMLRPHAFVRGADWWTLVTSALVHADVAHLLFNAFTFWAFAFSLERTIGSGRFAALLAVGLVASSAGTIFKHRNDPGYRTLGASGVILAVLFASVVYFPTQSIFILPLPVPIPAPWFALGYLAYTVFAARANRGRVNHDAHLSGALAGIAFVGLTDPAALTSAVHFVFK